LISVFVLPLFPRSPSLIERFTQQTLREVL